MKRFAFLIGVYCMVTMLGFAGGYMFHSYADSGMYPDHSEGEIKVDDTGTFEIDGWTINLSNGEQDEVLGDNSAVKGYTWRGSDDIVVRSGMSAEQVYTTCVHEKMHGAGMRGFYTPEHDYVHDLQDQVVDPTCLKLLAEAEPQTSKQVVGVETSAEAEVHYFE